MKKLLNNLTTNNLPKLFESNWFEKQKKSYLKLNSNVDLSILNQDEDEDSQSFNHEKIIKQLINGNEIFLAANKLIRREFDANNCDREVIPLVWAINEENIELFFALLALGEDVNEYQLDDSNGYDLYDYPISVAMQSDEKFFNLLLLDQNINIHIVGSHGKDDDEAARYYYREENIEYLYPLKILLRPEYHKIHKYLNINWNEELEPEYAPLMFYVTKEFDFKSMNMLNGLEANINPIIPDTYEYGPRLINYVFGKDIGSKNKLSKVRLHWYSKYTNMLSCEGCENSLFIDDLALYFDSAEEKKEILDIFEIEHYIDIIKEKEDLEEQIGELYDKCNPNIPIYEREFSILDAEHAYFISQNRYKQLNRKIEHQIEKQFHLLNTTCFKFSIFADLIKSCRFIFDEKITDIEFIKGEGEHWLAFYIDGEPYPTSIALKNEFLYDNQVPLDTKNCTPFEIIYFFLRSDIRLFYLIELLANQKNITVFKFVDRKPLISFDSICFFYELYKNGKITSELKEVIKQFDSMFEHTNELIKLLNKYSLVKINNLDRSSCINLISKNNYCIQIVADKEIQNDFNEIFVSVYLISDNYRDLIIQTPLTYLYHNLRDYFEREPGLKLDFERLFRS